MDQLELLKQQWKTREQELPKLSYAEIYSMLLKRSSSVTKWIFIISLIEIAFWIGLHFIMPESGKKINEGMGLSKALILLEIVQYTIFAGFIYLFYKNYKSIQVTDSVKELMQKILKTRRTLRYFVYYNIGVIALSLTAVNIYYYFNKEHLFELMQTTFPNKELSMSLEYFTTVFFVSQVIVGLVFIGLLALIYYLVYGMMMRRLKRNYIELKKLEI